MAEYTRQSQRFFVTGLQAMPADALAPGKIPWAVNVRCYEDGTFTPRVGLTSRISSALGSGIHSLARLNDGTAFNGGVSAVRVLGSGTEVYRGAASGNTFSLLDTGYSGNPVTTAYGQPPQSPRPYLYVADTSKQRKFTTDGIAQFIGIPQPSLPTTAPTVAVQGLSTRYISALGYAAAGTAATTPTTELRINTTIGQILYDSGSTGYASVVPASLANMTVGAVLTFESGPTQENTIITDLTIPVTPTTVAAIIYDSGVTGLCTIQPAGSLGTGQLDAPSWAESNRAAQIGDGVRYAVPRGTAGLNQPIGVVTGPTRRIRQVDFPVNALVVLNGAETVRILSVAYGQDGSLSFRCRTNTTISAGHTITGLSAVRVHLTNTFAPGAAIFRQVAQNTLSYPVLPDGSLQETTSMTGGIQGVIATTSFAQFSDGRAVLPDDEVHLSMRVSAITQVTSIRIYFDVDAAGTEAARFLQNYYFYEWRASDIAAAIQATNAAEVTPLVDARRTVVTNQQLSPWNFGDLRDREVADAFVRSSGVGQRELAAYNAQQASGTTTTGGYRRAGVIQGTPTGDAATTRQLALGNNQWIELRARVRDLVRIGTDPTRSLADIGAVEVLVSAEAIGRIGDSSLSVPPLTVQYGDIWCAGGAGPDVGDVGDPYLYTYRYRSSATGAVSNPAPAQRGGVIPRRQAVKLTPTVSSDPEVDKIDWFRFGSTLTRWSYIGTGSNNTTPYEDRLPDSAIEGIQSLEFDNFQPWPTQDLPRTGTCNVAGTSVTRVSGDSFNTSWAPGSALIINGLACTLYASPSSANALQVNESLGSGSAVAFTVPGATLLGQPLPSWWGDFQGVWFGCGDPNNPGTLYWTHGNNPEAARDADTLTVTTPSEPLQGGGIWNTFPFVFSSEDFYQILNAGQALGGRFRVVKTPCGKGSWTRWSFCLTPFGIAFLSADGIYLTAGGSPAVSLSEDDLRAIFPNDGNPGVDVNGIQPPDMSLATRLRLSYVSGYLYFDYRALNGLDYTLIYDMTAKRWLLDQYGNTGMWTRIEEPGAQVFNQILGGLDGGLYQYDEAAITDDGTPFAWALWSQLVDAGQPRVTKQFGDLMVSLNAQGSVDGIQIIPVADDWNTVLALTTVGAGDFGRQAYTVEINNGSGVLARNFGIRIAGTMQVADTARPGVVLWEPSFIPKGDAIGRRASDWDTLGYIGAKFVQGLILTANTYGQNKEIMIQRDSAEDMILLTINHDGETTIEYPSASQSLPGWTPFIAHQVRIFGQDEVPWQLLNYRFVYEPHPELATQWETQHTSHGVKGYLSVRDVVIAHASDGDIRLRVRYDDGATDDYTIPASGGTDPLFYTRTYLPLRAGKGKAVQYQLRSGCPFRLFKSDCSVRVYDWGSGQAYMQERPFGGPHYADGASI